MSALSGLTYGFAFLFFLLIPKARCTSGDCRNLEFRSGHTFKGKRLINHIINVTEAMDERFCRILCHSDYNCISFNFLTRGEAGRQRCELNDASHIEYTSDLKSYPSYTYNGAENACINNGCKNNATCQAGFTGRGYRCLCIPGFKGQDCEINAFTSCKEIYDFNLFNENKAYQLRVGTQRFLVYCHLSRTDLGSCGAGGWTLVMKIDGKKRTFHWGSSLWQNKQTFNLTGGETGFDEEETKLPTYWVMPFTKICLGMKIGQQHKFILVEKEADSLHSLIADGKYRHTSLGRDTWKSLIGSQASLQLECNKEGFNAVGSVANSKARIGVVANEQNNCGSCDSRIGFGTGGSPDDSNTCGNVAVGRHGADNGDKGVKAMGYILIQ